MTGGTALPIALYWRICETESNLNVSGKDCMRAASRVENRL